MPYFKFGPNDIFHNRIKTYPKTEFAIYDGRVYYNNNPFFSGTQPSRVTNINHVDVGFISLYELNVDRDERPKTATDSTTQLIYPFITKHGSLASFKTISTNKFNTDFNYGDVVTSSYPLSATISRDFYDTGISRTRIDALRTTLDYYTVNSPHYAYSASFPPGCEKNTQPLNLISIPSIFYGSSIRKGSVHLKFYGSGTLLAELHDINKNGDLIEITSSVHSTGSVAGVVLYNEGFLVLTGAWGMHPGTFTDTYKGSDGGSQNPQWVFFGTTEAQPVAISSSFHVEFEGINYIPTLTMMTHAPKGMLNNSTNPTFIKSGSFVKTKFYTNFTEPVDQYVESKEFPIKNIVSSSHPHFSESFKKQTYISQIGLFDDDKNLIAIAKLATPVKKTEDREFTFKLKLDF